MLSPEQEALIGRVFERYLAEHHHGDILQLIADTDEETHHPVVVNAMTLFEANMEVGDYFNAYPNDVLAIFDKVLLRTAMELSENASPKHRMTHTPHARITGLPVCPELTRDTIPRSRDVGHFLSVTGTVIRTSVAKVLEYERDYMCTKCRHVFTVQADFEQFYTFVQVSCPNPSGCNSYNFSCLSGGSEPAACRDYQEIKIQEQVQRLSVGCIPRSMVVVLEDDLVDSCKSGDDVTVYGVMCQRWKPFYDGSRCEVELVLKANNIEVNNQQAAAALVMKDVQKEFEDFWDSYRHDRIAGRNQILLSLCPQVFGMYLIKLAVAMVLAGGVQRIDSSGTKIRGECHMLLVGDPGTGKSQFLKYAAKIMPRSVLTAGIGSTSAGLTVTAVKDGGDWHLEAGALVLSDGGLCCIDEFNSIKEHDRISIHEAMEQQSISVAKAGMVCKLNTRTTILAATNPKGHYNPNEPLSVNVALASPLLSRFDLVLVLMDTRNAEWDRIISSFILEDRGVSVDSSSLWSMEKMKAYFSVIKRLKPQVSDEANSILTRYYQLQRQSDSRNTARTTIRMLESLSRLAEAHARLMYRETVTIEDAVMAVSVMECSMQGCALLGNVNVLLTSFPADPGQQYQTQCQVLLEGLNLPRLLQKEMDRLARLQSNSSEGSPPTDNYQHQPRDTNSINKTPRHDVSSNCKGDGLDWFRSIIPTLEPDVKDNRKHEKNENIRVKSSGPQEERQKDQKDEDSSGFVFQRVSKKLRDTRLRELELNHQQCDKVGGGGRGERVVSGDSARKNVTGVLESHTSSTLSSGKNCPSNNPAQDNLSSVKEDRKDQTGTKNISTALREKTAGEAETHEELHSKFSGFVFKPRKMRALVHNHELTVSSECNRDNHNDTESRISQQTPGRQDDSAGPLADTERKKRQKGQSQSNSLYGDGSRRKHVSCVSKVGEGFGFTSEELDKDVFSFREDELAQVGRIKRRNNTEKKSRLTTGDETVDNFTSIRPLKPSTSISDPAPSKREHTTSTVSSSALAKLSRFSFTCAAGPTRTAQSKVETNPSTGVEKGPDGAERPRGNSKDETTLNSTERSPLGKKIRTAIISGKVNESELAPGQKDGQGSESPTETMSKVREKQIEPAHSVTDAPPDCQNTVSGKKRKCFELGPVSGSKGAFSGLSLFGSAELSNDVLDTDWDQEVSKKAKI
ncbi:DNA helicase MCM9 [Symphorus nematophorus]